MNCFSISGFSRGGATSWRQISRHPEAGYYLSSTSQPQGKKKAPLCLGNGLQVEVSSCLRYSGTRNAMNWSTRLSIQMVALPIHCRWRWAESGTDYEAVVVTPEQMIVILNELDTPDTRLEWTLALVHASTVLRPEEAFGLKWRDIDWLNGQIRIGRAWSKGKETPGKTEGSMTQVVMHPALAQALSVWRQESVYSGDADWVFASTRSKGKTPRSAGVAGQDYLRPAAVKAGAIPAGYRGRFGWHNLRHSLATFFAANEVNLPVIQSMLRHSRPGTTAVYTLESTQRS